MGPDCPGGQDCALRPSSALRKQPQLAPLVPPPSLPPTPMSRPAYNAYDSSAAAYADHSEYPPPPPALDPYSTPPLNRSHSATHLHTWSIPDGQQFSGSNEQLTTKERVSELPSPVPGAQRGASGSGGGKRRRLRELARVYNTPNQIAFMLIIAFQTVVVLGLIAAVYQTIKSVSSRARLISEPRNRLRRHSLSFPPLTPSTRTRRLKAMRTCHRQSRVTRNWKLSP